MDLGFRRAILGWRRGAASTQCRKPCGSSADSPCRIRPFWPSFFIFFIIPAMSWYCFRSRLTSGTVVPEPDAMRRRREPFNSFGLRRSALVIEEMIASWRLMMRLVDIGVVELLLDLADPGQHAEHAAHPAHAADLPQLRGEVVEVELALLHLAGELFGLVLVDRLGGLLDQADDVAHAEDAAGDALGVERFERVDLLAGADQHDRLAGDRAHRQRRAAARVAVDPGQHDAGDAGALAEGLGDIDRVLAGHRIGDEQRLVRVAASRTAATSSISSSLTWSRPAVSSITTS